MRWTDEAPVMQANELLSFNVYAMSVSIQHVQDRAPVLEGKHEWHYRLTIGNLFGSESLRFDTLDNLLRGAQRLKNHLGNQEDREREGKKRRHFDHTKLPGLLFREHREPQPEESE